MMSATLNFLNLTRPKSLILGVSLLLGGCMVGPNYKPAAVPPAANGAFIEPTPSTAALPPHWWRLYDDPTLDALVDEALKHNTDVRVAAANLKKARYVLAQARGNLLPTTTTSAQYSHNRVGVASLGPTGGSIPAGVDSFKYDSYTTGLDVNWEIDLFGGLRRGIEAAKGDYAATAAALDAARVAVAADTTRAYAESCGYAAQATSARETPDFQQRTLDLTNRLNDGGRGTQRDVDEARALYEQSRASLATLDAEHRATLDALAVLTGRTPADLDPVVGTCTTPPKLKQVLPVGDGRALLARRPDVRKAERTLAADTARIGVATADLFPKISLLGAVSLGSTKFSDLGKSRSLNYSLGPLISWSFPNISDARARIHQANAQAEASLASFDGTVLTALKETEQALARLQGEGTKNEALAAAAAASGNAAKLTRYRFDAGSDNFLQLLDAERTRAAANAALSASDTALVDAQVDLFKALGGGWEEAPPVAEKAIGGK